MAEGGSTEVSGGPDGVRPWDVLVLASLAPLGGFPAVRLSPRLTQEDLGAASAVAIPRAPGEFLAGVVRDSDGVGPVLLTNHRIIWFERIAPPADGPKVPMYSGRAAAFEDVAPEAVTGVDPERPGVNLGGGRFVPLPPEPRGLADALAGAVRTLAHAARTGEVPAIDPELARRVAGAIPAIVRVDAGLRARGEDRSRFREDLLAAAPGAKVSRLFIASCVLTYAAMVAKGVPPMNPTAFDLMPWGADEAVRVALGGEYWRLPASVFLHGGGIHLAVNMWALASIGPFVERLFGSLRYAALYMAAGLGGAIASMATPPAKGGVGASGALFGIVGGLLAFLLVRRRSVPSTVLHSLRSQMLGLLVINIALGMGIPVIDQSAHLGGLATGFLAGLILAPPWPRGKPRLADRARSLGLAATVAALVVAAGFGAVRWRAGTITPADILRDYFIQAQPALIRFSDAEKETRDLAKALKNRNAAADPALAEALGRLEGEGRANLAAIARIRTPEPQLAKAVDLLAAAQREQLEAVRAARRQRDTDDLDRVEAEADFRSRVAAMEFLDKQCAAILGEYVRANRLESLTTEDADGP